MVLVDKLRTRAGRGRGALFVFWLFFSFAVNVAYADSSRVIATRFLDMVYDASRQQLYASLPTSGGDGGRVVPIDPVTGTIGTPLYIGESPSKITLSDDGHYLHVGLSTPKAVQRIDLDTLAADLRFSLGSDPQWGPRSLIDLEAVPGSPGSVAVATTVGLPSYRVAIYDNGVEKPQSFQVIGDDLGFAGSASQLDVCNRQSSGSEFTRLVVGPGGVSLVDVTKSVPCKATGGMRYHAGRFYGDGGRVLDPTTNRLAGLLPGGGVVVADSSLARAFGVSSGTTGLTVSASDLDRFVLLGSTKFNGSFGAASQVVRWGDDGLAVRTANELILVRSSLVHVANPADLSLNFTGTYGPVTVGQNVTYTLEVHNAGPASASGVVVTAVPPLPVVSVPSNCTGTFSLSCSLGVLDVGQSATIEIVLNASFSGRVSNTASVTAAAPDTHPADNTATQTILVDSPVIGQHLSIVDLTAKGLAVDPNTGRLLASVGGADPRYGNTVCAIDPETGSIMDSLYVGSEPGALAVSDDGRYLYVALAGSESVRRVDLESWTPGSEIWVDRTPSFGAYTVDDLEAVPGDPMAFVVARKSGPNPGQGIAVYDDSGVRPHVVNPPSTDRIEFGTSAAELYGYEAGSSGNTFVRMQVDAQGVSVRDSFVGLISGSGDIAFNDGRIYSAHGEVVDPEVPRRLGLFPGNLTSTKLAAGAGRTFVASSFSPTILAYDQGTFEFLGSITPPGGNLTPVDLVDVGAQRLALATSQGFIVLIDSPLVAVSSQSADIAVVQQDRPDPALAGEELTYRIVVHNGGPAHATGVVVTDVLPAGASVVSTTEGCDAAGGVVRCTVGDVPAGGGAAARITIRPANSGPAVNTVSVAGAQSDPRPLNNTDSQTTRVAASATADRIAQLDLTAKDLIYDSNSGRILASVSGLDPHYPNCVVAIDPSTGTVVASTFVGSEPGKLAISGDGHVVYVALTGSSSIRRLDAASLTSDLEFPAMNGGGPFDLAVCPGQPGTVAAVGSAEVAVYDDGVKRGSSAYSANVIEYGASPARIYGYVNQSSGFEFSRMNVDAQGVSLLDFTQDLVTGFNVDIRFDRGRVFTSDGDVIDPEARTRIGTFPGNAPTSKVVAPDPLTARVYLLEQPYAYTLAAFDRDTLSELGSLALPTDLSFFASSLIRWGANGLAFLNTDNRAYSFGTAPHVYLLRTALVPAPDADGDGIPDAEDVCPGISDPAQSDADGDGVGDACDLEICNGQDDDGDGRVDEGCDDDGDGYCDARMIVAAGATCVHGGGDCADDNPTVYPGARESCNGLDDNCSGLIDEPFQDARILSMAKPSPNQTSLQFATADESGTYDVIRGSLGVLVSSHGDFSVATTDCLANDASATSLRDDQFPVVGAGYWYLVRVQRLGANAATYDAAACFQIASRDASIQASPAACP
jgi:uncharacterized repeat protein (TIGR01451 family)